jgi:flagellar biogenesis protein FliO
MPTARIDARTSRRLRSLGFGGSLVIGHRALVILTIACLVSVASSLSAAPLISTNLPPVSPALPDASFSVIRVFGALVLVLGLFLGGVWLFKNWQRLTIQRGRPSQLQILEMKALGGKHALYVVGYQQQRLLLASSPGGVALVSHLPAADAAELAANPAAGPMSAESFVHALQQAVQGKA